MREVREIGFSAPPTRRQILAGAGALVAGALAPNLGRAAETPKKGGVLRLALTGGSVNDTLDIANASDSVMTIIGRGLYNTLVEWGDDGRPKPELAASWEARGGAKEWVFNLRRGVKFANGREFTADDAMSSLNYHRVEGKSGAARDLADIAEVKKLDKHQIQVTLALPDADFPLLLADPRAAMFPDGAPDWSRPIGTGAFHLDRFDPGYRIILRRNPDYWRDGRGHLDGADIVVTIDPAARIEALRAGQVDVINRVDPRSAAALERTAGLKLTRAAGGYHLVAAARTDIAPFDNPDLRTALKFAIDRNAIAAAAYGGYASLGNDHPVPPSDPFYTLEIGPRRRDPDRAAFLIKRAGLGDARIALHAPDSAFDDVAAMARVAQANWKAAGLNIELTSDPSADYWSRVWLKEAIVASYWKGRASATRMLATAYAAGSPVNETHWRNERFEKLLGDARAETEEARRKQYIWELQRIIRDDGGAIIPVFRDWLDGRSERVQGHTPHGGSELDNGYILEKAWLKG